MDQVARIIPDNEAAAPHTGAGIAAFSTTLFLSAALMFMLQPMMGKMLLPLVGGSPAGWIIAVAFFQVMLLVGYLGAHIFSGSPPRVHMLAYIIALAAGGLSLPVHLDIALMQEPNAFSIFRALTAALGTPFIALAATSSTLQRLFANTRHQAAKDPYFLYAASNAGSLMGLLLYPVLIEPSLTLPQQTQVWQIGYALLEFACLVLVFRAFKNLPLRTPAFASFSFPRKEKWKIFILAFFPSALLLAVTTQITTDIFPAPMIWVIPLGLYLLTFIIAFSRKILISQTILNRLHPLAVASALFMLLAFTAHIRGSWLALLVQLSAFTIIALTFHTRLAAARPPGREGDGSRNLTAFYLLIAAGGAAGGLLNAFVFPVVLDRLIEYPVLLLLSCLLHPSFRPVLHLRNRIVLGCGAILFCIYVALIESGTLSAVHAIAICDLLLFSIIALSSVHPRVLMILCSLLLIFSEVTTPHERILTARGFFGVIRVFDRPLQIDNKTYIARYMYHGTTTHGFQILDPKFETTPTSYFSAAGPINDIFALYNPHKTLVVGLGTGTLACYARPDTTISFIEIDPLVIHATREKFTYLAKCGDPRILSGDGRIEIKRMSEKFDMIILDAFSSDAIPTHLITTEAIHTYLDHLAPNGLILFNITNRYFNLANVLAANAHAEGLKHRYKLDAANPLSYAAASAWIVMGRQSVSFAPLSDQGWLDLPVPPEQRPWTDDYTNLLSALEFQHAQTH
jgi:hypothetical protein